MPNTSNLMHHICLRGSARSSSPAPYAHFSRRGNGTMDERERHEAGMQVRRSALGDQHVDRAETETSDFDAAFQDLITRYAWGEIWTRPGLSRKTRSLVTIAYDGGAESRRGTASSSACRNQQRELPPKESVSY